MTLAPMATRAVLDSFKRQLKRHRKALARCRRKFSEKSVHAYRIETRRLLAVVELIAPFLPPRRADKARKGIKCHLDVFDELRDAQVQLQFTRQFADAYRAARSFRKQIKKTEARASRKARKRIKRLPGARLDAVLASSKRTFKAMEQDLPPGAGAQRLWQRASDIFEETRTLLAQTGSGSPAAIHCTRVAFKRFRYMVELLKPHLAFVTPARLEAMHDYQSMMGDIQDATVLLATWDKLVARGVIEAADAEAFRQALQTRQQQLIGHFLAHAKQLNRFWPAARPGRQSPTAAGG
jgi:CHAD domain-containing protein